MLKFIALMHKVMTNQHLQSCYDPPPESTDFLKNT